MGMRKKRPHRPYMTEGIPASTSTELLRNVEAAPSLKYSPRKIEMEREKGMEMIRARNDVKSVPARNGRAPNCSAAVFQVFDTKKAKPKVFIEGTA